MNDTICLICGLSGSGKSTIVHKLAEKGYTQVMSYTTRPQRDENDDHLFVTVDSEEYKSMKDGNCLAYMKDDVHGYEYWVTSEEVDKGDLYIIDINSSYEFIKNYHGDKHIRTCMLLCDPYAAAINIMKEQLLKAGVEEDILNQIYKYTYDRIDRDHMFGNYIPFMANTISTGYRSTAIFAHMHQGENVYIADDTFKMFKYKQLISYINASDTDTIEAQFDDRAKDLYIDKIANDVEIWMKNGVCFKSAKTGIYAYITDPQAFDFANTMSNYATKTVSYF